MPRPKLYANPDEAKRELKQKSVERAGVYVVRGPQGVWDARLFKSGDLIPGWYEYSHQLGEQPPVAKAAK